ncbi:MAG: AbrB/MazE/SpoVT family DNA-binding domain-containing protein [Acidilobus sp.]|nr:AbrB/MazE/SpoVT family DNA-binding domain-containing protein [Acidilobus sp.]MCG2890194.1 AbrB/MazE/SpoVT family DNA-binding domain-containing protein [Acidilobus sp.]
MSVTPRKLQRLGLSSLVVTLPRRWVEAHGLKPGDLVYVIDEGDRLRIVPAQPSEARRSYRFDAYKLAMPQLASAALTCLYVNNINDVVMDLKGMGEEGLKYLKQTSMRLLGLEVTQLDSERASVRIVLDDSRADPKMAIKGLGSAVGNIAELLRRASSGEALGSDEVEVATAELLKYQHLIMRHVVSSVSEGVIDTRVQGTIVGTAVLGVVGNVLLEALRLAQRWSLRSSRVAEVAGQLRDLIPMVSAMVAQPSVKRLHEASLTALSLSAWLEDLLGSSQDPKEAAVLSKVDDAVRNLMIVFSAILCSAVLSEDYLHAEGA